MEVVLPLAVVEVVDVVVLVVQIRGKKTFFFVSHVPQRVWENEEAPSNMVSMLISLDTSHLDMSMLNDDAEANMPLMSITLDTSHFDMSPLNDDAE